VQKKDGGMGEMMGRCARRGRCEGGADGSDEWRGSNGRPECGGERAGEAGPRSAEPRVRKI
jgi:hypothetical protein